MSVDVDAEKTKWVEPLMHTTGEYQRYRDTATGVSPLLFPPSPSIIKWSSYEHDESGFTTEKPEMIRLMHEKRRKKSSSLINHLKTLRTVNTFGSGKTIIFTVGSTTMSVLEALNFADIPATVVQPIYLEPFPVWVLEKYREKTGIVVELNSTGQLATLLHDKIGFHPQAVIQKYDGRPFNPPDLAKQIAEVG